MSRDACSINEGSDRELLTAGQSICACRQFEEILAALTTHLPILTGCQHWRLWMCDEMTGRWRQASGDQKDPTTEGNGLRKFVSNLVKKKTARFAPGENSRSTYWLPLAGSDEPAGVLAIELDQKNTPSKTLHRLDDLARFLGHGLDLTTELQRLKEQNITDDLTGLFNARHFRKLIDYELERARRYGNDLSLVFIDLDFFKRVNDTHGHLVGSQLLTEVGHFLMEHTRRVNLACRYGGDEFVLLLPSTGKTGAMTLAEKLRGDIAAQHFEAGAERPITVTASFGVASYPGDARTPENLIRLADEAMYRVKAAGRNGVVSC